MQGLRGTGAGEKGARDATTMVGVEYGPPHH